MVALRNNCQPTTNTEMMFGSIKKGKSKLDGMDGREFQFTADRQREKEKGASSPPRYLR